MPRPLRRSRPLALAGALGLATLFAASCSDSGDSGSDPTGPDDPGNPNPSVFEVQGSVDFTISNNGAADYLFSWTDATGTYTDIADPTLVLQAGQTYTFTRTTSAHPLRLTTNGLATSGTDGSYSRTTTSGADIDAVSLTPLADFTADPAPTTDVITWTPTAVDAGTYFYTCLVTSHTGMTGQIRVRAGS